MNKATLNRRNRERRAKRKERERGKSAVQPMTGFNRLQAEADQAVDAEVPVMLQEQFDSLDEDISTEELLNQIEAHIASLGLDESDKKSLGAKLETTAKELKKPEKKKDKDSSVESALTAPTGSDVGAFGRPAVSAAVEEALEEKPMEFMVDDPVDAPVDDLGVPSFDMIDPSDLAGSADIVQRGRMQEAADEFEEAGAPPRDPRIRNEMFMSAAPEEFEIAAQGPAMEEVATRDMLQRLAVARAMGSPEFLELYDELQTAVDRGNPAGTKAGKPRRSLTVDLGRRFDGAKVPERMVRQALRQYAQDYNRIRAGLSPVSGRRSRAR